MNTTADDYEYGGARALVTLHEDRLRRFCAVWNEARAAGLALPPTADRDCADLEHLLRHVLACAVGYMTWCCEVLELEAPDLPELPATVDDPAPLLEEILAGWRHSPLRGVSEKRFYVPTHPSRWNVDYCVDAMLEHAVMHPLRHEHQLRRLLDATG